MLCNNSNNAHHHHTNNNPSFNPYRYGYVLKAFPDEQIIVMTRPGEDGEETKKEGNFFTNWIDSVTSPIDSSDLKNKGEMTLNQNK